MDHQKIHVAAGADPTGDAPGLHIANPCQLAQWAPLEDPLSQLLSNHFQNFESGQRWEGSMGLDLTPKHCGGDIVLKG